MDVSKLIKEAKNESASAQKCLFDLFADKMMLICRRYVKNSEDAEELLLDGFYKFFKNLSSFTYQNEAALFVWLKKIMINECLMLLRKKNVFNMVSESAAEDVALEEEALNNLSAKEIFDLVLNLPVGYRTVFNLYVIEGMDHKEIAALLGIAEGTSKSQLSKAKALLQKIYYKTEQDMSSENHNNSDWRNKLEDENDLSAETLQNKNAMWGKLHNRLKEKPGRKKVLWYWTAAACLLPAILISLTLLLKNENNVVQNNVSKSEVTKPELKQIQPLKSRTVAVISAINVTKNKTRKIKTKSNNTAIVGAIKEHSETNIQIADNETISPFPAIDSSNTTNIAKAQTKKKLKVVHINELGDATEDLPETAHNTNLHYFQLKLANQEVYRNTSLTLNNTGINLFKTKISHSN